MSEQDHVAFIISEFNQLTAAEQQRTYTSIANIMLSRPEGIEGAVADTNRSILADALVATAMDAATGVITAPKKKRRPRTDEQMRCRHAGCQLRSGGPRGRFLCAYHREDVQATVNKEID